MVYILLCLLYLLLLSILSINMQSLNYCYISSLHLQLLSVNVAAISVYCLSNKCKKKNKNFMAPFYGMGSTASRLEPLRGGSSLFTTKFADIPGTHYTDLRRMKG